MIENKKGGVEVVSQSKQIGTATNNIAELIAIKESLTTLKKDYYKVDKHRINHDITIVTDSEYSIGVLTRDWKPKKNTELIIEIKKIASIFTNLKFKKVSAHTGNKMNDLAD